MVDGEEEYVACVYVRGKGRLNGGEGGVDGAWRRWREEEKTQNSDDS